MIHYVLAGSTDLDSHCGSLVYVDSFVAATPYYISRASPYYTTCKVHFSRSLSGKIKLTITGSSVDSDVCKVNVFDSLNIVSETGGNLNYYSSFTRSVTSDNSGQLYLHVQGAGCDRYGLSFSVQKVFSADCFEYTCDDGQCVTSYAACDGVDDCADGSDEDGCGFIWTTGGKPASLSVSSSSFASSLSLACFIVVVESPWFGLLSSSLQERRWSLKVGGEWLTGAQLKRQALLDVDQRC